MAELEGEKNLSVREHYASTVESAGAFLVRGAEPDGVSAYARARLRSNGIKDDLQSKRPNL